MWKNTELNYGRITKILHWFTALTVFSLFALGFWMVDLTYYSQWYKTAPYWHKSIGILLFLATLFRLIWRATNVSPKALASHTKWEKIGSKIAHLAIYVLLLTLMISGYLISTADERAIEVFTWFEVPALGELFDDQADISGVIHEYLAYTLIAISLLHAVAAIKHHIIDKDDTLKRMI
ncbi:MAG: cytochrome b [Alteromonadaceae bacterium]|nr:cytochrome b [Alteromonadaceae bacterium]